MLAASPALLLQTGAGTAPECPWGGFAALALCQGTPREPGAAWQCSWCCGEGHGQRGEGRLLLAQRWQRSPSAGAEGTAGTGSIPRDARAAALGCLSVGAVLEPQHGQAVALSSQNGLKIEW